MTIGKLVYLESQTYRILNLDKSEVSTDGTTKISGGCPPTKSSSLDMTLPTRGASAGNKSGCTATFIAGSTPSGWPIISNVIK